ncbi:hypothetical protein P9J82_01325 [Glaesserella parasuis]|nr:hypothetical protein [Glaesserella parasuis]MCT8553452.1 hypothetical protein [Glaesserella parasuis]MCT8559926.1 hypothetical protein [Glaesserella parasuis]MCT8566508.1 hypothetical protein [Glaesserella parasuis]MCT8582095.1 hypothetical protein [Glaesserella parasuis]MCT8586902.1 hypothetical protein [Glaesserella parasuis]
MQTGIWNASTVRARGLFADGRSTRMARSQINQMDISHGGREGESGVIA